MTSMFSLRTLRIARCVALDNSVPVFKTQQSQRRENSCAWVATSEYVFQQVYSARVQQRNDLLISFRA